MLPLQRILGNRAVQQLLAANSGIEMRSCSSTKKLEPCFATMAMRAWSHVAQQRTGMSTTFATIQRAAAAMTGSFRMVPPPTSAKLYYGSDIKVKPNPSVGAPTAALGAPFKVIADFAHPAVLCGAGRYRQMISGVYLVRMAGETSWLKVKHPLGSRSLEETKYNEDTDASGFSYGDRSLRADTSYYDNPNNANGCTFHGFDFPQLPAYEGIEELEMRLYFQGKLEGVSPERLATWSVVGKAIVPATAAKTKGVQGPRLLYGFESDTQSWTGHFLKPPPESVPSPPWSVTEWHGSGSHSLKADIDLGGKAMPALSVIKKENLSGMKYLQARVKQASWGNAGSGVSAKLFIKTGNAWAWYDSSGVTIPPAGSVTLIMDLSSVPDIADVRELGVQFATPSSSSGQTAIYIADVSVW